jgi:hypothetical protein
VEFKGNYIQDLVLLRRKVQTSAAIDEAFARVLNTGGRKSQLMLAQLVRWLGGVSFALRPWDRVQGKLLAYLDAQVLASWHEFSADLDALSDELECTRASEAPALKRGQWSAAIPRCAPRNTTCRVVQFMRDHSAALAALLRAAEGWTETQRTAELDRILAVAKTMTESGRFEWHGTACRRIGDLLIGLQAIGSARLISSNYREHGPLSEALGYSLVTFPVADIRQK